MTTTMSEGSTHQSTRAQVQRVLEGVSAEDKHKNDNGIVVNALRSPHYSLSDFLIDLDSTKSKVLSDSTDKAEVVESWKRLDAFAATIIRSTASVHEEVIENCQVGFAELDEGGVIVYANNALLQMLPNAVGQRLQECVDKSEEISEVIFRREHTNAIQVTLHTGREPIPVNLDVGPIQSHNETSRLYALIADRRPHLQTQVAGLEAAPLGALRVTKLGRITFTNTIAAQMLEAPPQQLRGRRLGSIFGTEGERLSAKLPNQLAAGVGFSEELSLARANRPPLPLRLFVLPQFDSKKRTSGALVFLRSIEHEVARNRIYKACEEHRNPRKMLQEVLAILKEVLPYDVASFGVYAEGMRYFRALLVDPEPEEEWPTRWFEIPEEMANWIRGEQLWVPDIEEFYKERPEAEHLYQNPVTQAYLRAGIKSFIAIPVRQQSDVVTVLSLCSRTPNRYGAEEAELVRLLPVEQALRMADEAFEQLQREFIRETLTLIAAATSHAAVAEIVAKQLCYFFNWNHVTILKVNRLKGCFQLLAQCDATNGQFAVPSDYEQGLTEGMLSKCLEAKEALYIDDTRAASLPYPYKRVCDLSRSTLTVPIMMDGSVAWILNVETAQTHAFHGPDRQAVVSVVGALTRTLDRMFQLTLTEDILDLTDQGIIVVDAAGRIRQANSAAERMLGAVRSQLTGKRMAEFASTEDNPGSRDILEESTRTSERHVALRTMHGRKLPVIVSLRRPSDEYDHKIWLMTDTSQKNWNHDFRYMRQISHEVAQQTRAPLMLAEKLTKKCKTLVSDDAAKDLLDRAVRLLDKADITYERLLRAYERSGALAIALRPADLGRQLASVVECLPAEDREHIVSQVVGEIPGVAVDSSAIDFVLRSIVMYLLRRKPAGGSVLAEVASEYDGVLMTFLAPGAKTTSVRGVEIDVLAYTQAEARELAALNPSAIREIVEAHGGEVRLPDGKTPSNTVFRIWLPAAGNLESNNA